MYAQGLLVSLEILKETLGQYNQASKTVQHCFSLEWRAVSRRRPSGCVCDRRSYISVICVRFPLNIMR